MAAQIAVAELEQALGRDWLSAKDAGKVMDRTTQHVWVMAKQGRIGTLQLPGGGVLYSRADIEAIVAAREGVGE